MLLTMIELCNSISTVTAGFEEQSTKTEKVNVRLDLLKSL